MLVQKKKKKNHRMYLDFKFSGLYKSGKHLWWCILAVCIVCFSSRNALLPLQSMYTLPRFASAAMAYSTFCYSMLTMQLPPCFYFDLCYSALFLRCLKTKNMQTGTSMHWIQLHKKWSCNHSPNNNLLLVCYSCILSTNQQKNKQVFQLHL